MSSSRALTTSICLPRCQVLPQPLPPGSSAGARRKIHVSCTLLLAAQALSCCSGEHERLDDTFSESGALGFLCSHDVLDTASDREVCSTRQMTSYGY